MYLKNIEIQGFKSFARKITFDFHEGITGIVGPNGSGKSNVADAVRWVFGEQKVKQLRGGSMQDVIFSGTELRKPLSFASVSITLDNADHKLAVDYEEVTITRKLYRSGESEYLMNGSTCRLKDINELFYDTGIGKEGYSIIGQGQIDKILSGKPEDRRELFDEAAGIVKFKKRKNLSVKKLEEERQNLVRVSDILSELEKQIGPLEKQSAIAKEFLAKKEELKIYDINMFLLEAEKSKMQLQEVDSNMKIAMEHHSTSESSFASMKEEYELAEDEIDEMSARIEKLRHQGNETNILKQQLEGKINLLNEQINSIRMNDEHFGNRVLVIQEEMSQREQSKVQLEIELSDIDKQVAEEKTKELEASNILNDIQKNMLDKTDFSENMKKEIIDLLNNRASTKAKIQRFETMLEQGNIRKSQINRRLIEIQTERIESEDVLEGLKSEKVVIDEKLKKITIEMTSLEEEIEKIQKLLSIKITQEKEVQGNFHREQSKLEALKNLTERYDGYGNSIRKVMERKAQVPGLVGVVADIIKTEKKYEIAIETALGGSIQNIVTDTDVTAKKMVQYLKENRLGRATFLPLTSVKGGQNIRYPEVLKENGVLGIASTLVSVDGVYQKLAENLLGRTIVVDTIDTGVSLGRKYQHSLRIVTLEGELLNPGGSITGGAFKNTSNLLGRRREIEALEENVVSLRNSVHNMGLEIEEDKTRRNQFYSTLDQLKVELQKSSVLQNTMKLKISQIENKINEIDFSYQEISTECDEIEVQNVQIVKSINDINQELSESESRELLTTNSITDIQNEIEHLKGLEVDAIKNSEVIHLSLASAIQKYNFVNENYMRIEGELLKFKEELDTIEDAKGNTSTEIQEKLKEISAIQESIEDAIDLCGEIENEIQKHVLDKEALTQKHKSLLIKREDISKQITELDKEIYRLNDKKERYEAEAEKTINYMWEEYEITYNYALELRNPEMTNLELMKRNIKDLKTSIKGLGSVNVNAIEDYKEVSERYIFLKTQHDDLIEAEKTLLDIIDELDIAMRTQFKEQFTLIASEYDRVFKQLFGGGKGTLELMDSDDVLDAGVKIIAQPPGKKLQNMMQLSGGEKALTAISLLFAIQNLKPSPFCLLDEIEAALDDSNVVRFAKYLHKLTKDTQFIVITHRRGTMTASDRLYGITMQEKGVSTLVSVDLLQDELTN